MDAKLLDETHDPRRRSWVGAANAPGADFPIQNLPFGVFRRGPDEPARAGVAIGDRILDLPAAADAARILAEEDPAAFRLDGEAVAWRGLAFGEPEVAAARAGFATAIGSCSFREPVEEIRELGVRLA